MSVLRQFRFNLGRFYGTDRGRQVGQTRLLHPNTQRAPQCFRFHRKIAHALERGPQTQGVRPAQPARRHRGLRQTRDPLEHIRLRQMPGYDFILPAVPPQQRRQIHHAVDPMIVHDSSRVYGRAKIRVERRVQHDEWPLRPGQNRG